MRSRRLLLVAALLFGSAAATPASAIQPIHPNDFFAKARLIGSLPYEIRTNNLTATTEPDEPLDCFVPNATLWYRYTPAADEWITVDILDRWGERLAIYSGTALTDLTPERCLSYEQFREDTSMKLTGGRDYWFRLGSDPHFEPGRSLNLAMSVRKAGAVSGRVTTEEGDPLPGIDVTAQAGRSFGRDTTDADGRYLIEGLFAGLHDVYFSDWNHRGLYRSRSYAPWPNMYAVPVAEGTETSGIDVALHRNGSISGRITDRDGAPLPNLCAAAIDQWRNSHSARTDADGRYRFGVQTPGPVVVQFQDCTLIGSWRPQFYPGVLDRADATVLTVTDGVETTGIDAMLDPLTVPPNDDRSAAEPIGALPARLALNTMRATLEPDETTPCGAFVEPQATVWYRLDVTEAGRYAVEVDDAAFAHFVAVYTEPALGPVSSVCRSHSSTYLYKTTLGFDAVPGTAYWIQVGGYQDYWPGGEIRMTVDRHAPPPNATPETAAPIGYGETVTATTIAATADTVATTCGTMSRAVWYRITAQGPITLRSDGSSFGTSYAAFEDIGAIRRQAGCRYGSSSASSSPWTFNATPGSTYLIAVGESVNGGGRLRLSIDPLP